MKQYLRNLPSIHELQLDGRFKELLAHTSIDSTRLTKWLREVVEVIRGELLEGSWKGTTADFSTVIFQRLQEKLTSHTAYKLQTIINGTGTVLHTNLGRARLSEEAIHHVVESVRHYSNLEFDIESGKRGSRHAIVEELICEATGAQSAMVVNNNAAAVYLILKAFARNKEVIVSRGQLVEIGGSFRVSSIMEESGAKLIEVGTTNKTHLSDYEDAINEDTAMMMKVHTSNFRTVGFTSSVETTELVKLTEGKDLILYEDLGSGALYDYRKHGIGEEPPVQDIIAQGVHLVSFSGDKLLGGPQAGIIAGDKQLIDKLKKHQLARVLRVDKMTLAALEATLLPYVKGEMENIPTVRDLLVSEADIKAKAEWFMHELSNSTFTCMLLQDVSQVGGGTMPDVELPTWTVRAEHVNLNAQQISDLLRKQTPSILCRIKHDTVVIDFRTITNDELRPLVDGLLQIH